MTDAREKSEELLLPISDLELTEEERRESEAHLGHCGYCGRRYRFEESLRRYVRQAWIEEMPAELKERLAALRTPL